MTALINLNRASLKLSETDEHHTSAALWPGQNQPGQKGIRHAALSPEGFRETLAQKHTSSRLNNASKVPVTVKPLKWSWSYLWLWPGSALLNNSQAQSGS